MKKKYFLSSLLIFNILFFQILDAKVSYHKVKKGETLYTIAKKYKKNLEKIKTINGFDENTIYPGQIIRLPKKNYGIYHRVKKGETLYTIAKKYKRYQVDYTTIVKKNQIKDVHNIPVDKKIFIPLSLEKKPKKKRKTYKKLAFYKPLKGRLTGRVGYRFHPLLQKLKYHNGLDIAAPKGSQVKASFFGRVVYVGYKKGYGKLIILKHPYNYTTYYGHLSRVLVRKGQRIKRGRVIGYVGETGLVTGPHLHFEIRYKNNPIRILNRFKKLRGQIGNYWG